MAWMTAREYREQARRRERAAHARRRREATGMTSLAVQQAKADRYRQIAQDIEADAQARAVALQRAVSGKRQHMQAVAGRDRQVWQSLANGFACFSSPASHHAPVEEAPGLTLLERLSYPGY